MKAPILLPLAILAPLLGNSCATIIQGKTAAVTFASVQPGASIEVDGQKHKTPALVTISKKTTTATFTHPSYPARKIEWKRDFQKDYVLLNIIFTPGMGSSGIATDTATGAIWGQPKTITYDFKTKKVSVEKVHPEKTPEEKAKEPKRFGRPV